MRAIFKAKLTFCWTILAIIFILCHQANANKVVEITEQNIDNILSSNELVILNFYVDWCQYSTKLKPVFEDAAQKISETPTLSHQVVLGRIHCEREPGLSTRFQIRKYPTIKVVRNGEIDKFEYRGKRSANSILEYVKEELKDPILEFKDLDELNVLDRKKRLMVAYFERRDLGEYEVYRKVATNQKNYCQFHVGFKDVVKSDGVPDANVIVFKPYLVKPEKESGEDIIIYGGNLNNFTELNEWVQRKCIPIVREITYENAEEITEEDLPLVILFHTLDDVKSLKEFEKVVETELSDQREKVNFVTADSKDFSHPLYHLGKSEDHLPLIAIDSFRHMYLFPDFEDIHKKGKLKRFIDDLFSGKLHLEFHYGPQTTSETESESEPDSGEEEEEERTVPAPESKFKDLRPSKHRYSFKNRDEL